MGIKETKDAIKAAGEAFVTWGKTTAKVTGRHFGPYYPNLWLRQHRHDILMKFFSLMKEHENDLARIIVSPNTFII
jgi:succinate-semialdehyde dehydrogenase/glutarate-semialdehyde dehydrogenase